MDIFYQYYGYRNNPSSDLTKKQQAIYNKLMKDVPRDDPDYILIDARSRAIAQTHIPKSWKKAFKISFSRGRVCIENKVK